MQLPRNIYSGRTGQPMNGNLSAEIECEHTLCNMRYWVKPAWHVAEADGEYSAKARNMVDLRRDSHRHIMMRAAAVRMNLRLAAASLACMRQSGTSINCLVRLSTMPPAHHQRAWSGDSPCHRHGDYGCSSRCEGSQEMLCETPRDAWSFQRRSELPNV